MKTYVTGFGLCTPQGNEVELIFENLVAGKSSTRIIDKWKNKSVLTSPIGAPITEFDSSKIPRSARKTMSRASELATVATLDAIRNAKLDMTMVDPIRCVYILGSATNSAEEVGPLITHLYADKNFTYGHSFLRFMNHTVAANVSSALGLQGSLIPISSACATSAQAIVLGWELLQTGLYDVVICGGADELDIVTPVVFESLRAASQRYTQTPEKTPRPFDKDRDGIVASEGAAIIVLESEKSVARRGVTPHSEVLAGYSFKSGAKLTQNSADSIEITINTALNRAGLSAEEIDYINAHATGTISGDAEEAAAIKKIFKKSYCPVSSLKGHFGHSFAACGALELIMSISMLKHQLIIPTLNLEVVAEDCEGINHIQRLTKAKIETVLTNNFGFGGVNTSIIIKKWSKQDVY